MKDVLEQVMQAKEAVEAQNRQLIEQIEQNTASLATFQEAANGSEEEATAVVSNPLRSLRELRIGEGCFFCTVVLFVHSTPAPRD